MRHSLSISVAFKVQNQENLVGKFAVILFRLQRANLKLEKLLTVMGNALLKQNECNPKPKYFLMDSKILFFIGDQ